MRKGVWGIVAAVVLSGCRDLTVPDEDSSSNPDQGPSVVTGLVVLEPDEQALGSKFTRAVHFRLRLSAKNGVGEVDLRCGENVLAAWDGNGASADGQPLYLDRTVDLLPCIDPLAEQANAEVTVKLIARDTTELEIARWEKTFLVDLSLPVVPVLSASLPQQVVAGRPLDFLLHSSAPLEGLPSVLIDGAAATVEAASPDGLSFRVLSPALELGLRRVKPGDPVTQLILEESSRPVGLEIAGRSALGFESRLQTTLTVSRVAWERTVPGIIPPLGFFAPSPGSGWITPPPDAPVASAHGLTVALQGPTDGMGIAVGWVPGFFEAQSGEFRTLPETALTAMGLSTVGLEREGGAVLALGNGRYKHFGFADQSGAEETPSTVPDGFVALGNRLCYLDARFELNATLECDGNTEHSLRCLGAGVAPTLPVVSLKRPDLAAAPGRFQFTAGAQFVSLQAPSALNGAGAFCASAQSFRLAGNQLQRLLPFEQAGGTQAEQILKVFPSESGAFALELTNTDWMVRRLLRWGPGGADIDADLKTFNGVDYRLYDPGVPTLPGYEVPLSLRADGTMLLMSMRPAAGLPTFVAQGPNGARMKESRFTGYFEPLESTVDSVFPLNVVEVVEQQSPPKFTSYVLVHRNGPDSGQYSVLAVDEQMNPRWVYHYPRVLPEPETSPLTLVGSSTSSWLYLVDSASGVVTALAR